MTVAMIAASEIRIAVQKARTVITRLHQRVRITRRLSGIRTKSMHMPAMKHPYMILEPILSKLRTVTASAGSAIWAPASSSLTRISTGLNQYHCLGLEQYVTPLICGVSYRMPHEKMENILIVVAFAEVPESNLVEIMQT
jgi:hypothetical protein